MTERREPAGPPAGGGSRRLTERVFRVREFGIIAVLLVFVAVTTSIQPSFLNQQNLQFLLINTTVYALLALGETMVVVSRNVDLSIGSVLGLSAYVSASMFGHHPGIPIPLVFLIGLGIGLACGMANGLMVAVGRVPSLVVTLATLYIIRGIDILIVGGNEVTAQTLPNSFTNIPRATVLGIPYLAIAIAVVIGIGAYYMRAFRSGRELYAIGSNPEAARLAGIPVGKRIFTAFTSAAHRRGGGGAVGRAVPDDRLDRGDRLRADRYFCGGGGRGGHLRRERERGGRGGRRAAAVQHQFRAERAGIPAVVARGHLRLPAPAGHHARPDHLGAPHDRTAAKESRRWNLT